MNLALFDLDNTLLAGDSDFEWAQFLITKGVVDRDIQEAKNIAFYDQYKEGTWHREYMDRHIRPLIGDKARQLVREHLANGDLCAVVTATNSFVTRPIVSEFGIPHLIGTVAAVDVENGAFSGSPRGTPSFRDGKIERVESWLESLGLWWGSFAESFFYSDSHNDLPLMGKVTTPVAVDPDQTLHRHSSEMGWKIITLR